MDLDDKESDVDKDDDHVLVYNIITEYFHSTEEPETDNSKREVIVWCNTITSSDTAST